MSINQSQYVYDLLMYKVITIQNWVPFFFGVFALSNSFTRLYVVSTFSSYLLHMLLFILVEFIQCRIVCNTYEFTFRSEKL